MYGKCDLWTIRANELKRDVGNTTAGHRLTAFRRRAELLDTGMPPPSALIIASTEGSAKLSNECSNMDLVGGAEGADFRQVSLVTRGIAEENEKCKGK